MISPTPDASPTAIGIPHYIMNFERQFEERVISNFVREYAGGRTPLPCAHCNSDLKFATLLERARGFGADHVATGHYARVEHDEATGRYRLRRGLDASKDQSYFLFSLDQAQLSRARFPVGALTKPEVRAHARALGLLVAEKPDSQEICFVPDGDYASFVARHAPEAAVGGAITDRAGRVLGRHEGIHRYTVGQRKGLRLSASEPLYVLALDPSGRTVVVGPREALERRASRPPVSTGSRVLHPEGPSTPLCRFATATRRRAPACRRCLTGVRRWSLPSRSTRSRRARQSCFMWMTR